jgi:hypothetical protein
MYNRHLQKKKKKVCSQASIQFGRVCPLIEWQPRQPLPFLSLLP